jgi:hypothetical protein
MTSTPGPILALNGPADGQHKPRNSSGVAPDRGTPEKNVTVVT